MIKNLPKFYGITDFKRFGTDLEKQILKMKEKGVGIVQLREKDLNSKDLYYLAKKVREITKKYNMLLTINDRLDIALLVGADGVHLPENSIPINIIKSKFPNLIVGKSCHSIECGKKAEEEGADYIYFSPIFYVEGKNKPVGLDGLKKAVESINIPIYALGGIKKENIKEVLNTGAYGIAGIRLFNS